MVDLKEAERIVHALEADLAKVQRGREDVQVLRDEVEALKAVLEAPDPVPERVGHGLRKIHAIVDVVIDDALKASDYVARIGRMLGM